MTMLAALPALLLAIGAGPAFHRLAAASPARQEARATAGLRVRGNRLVNASGKTIVLHGVNRSGAEYSCIHNTGIFDSPTNAASVRAMVAWHINAVRLPLNEDCWLKMNTAGISRAYVGASYRRAIVRYVDLLNRYGLIVLLDLHWSAPGTLQAIGQQPMPDADHAPAFWRSVAATFRANPNVIFDLYNEPYPDSNQDTTAAWACWKSGGMGTDSGSGGACPGVTYRGAGGNDTHQAYQAAGMQSLVDAVRSTGARQVLLLGGVQYANSLSGWLANEPHDPLGNLAAGWHAYSFNACASAAGCWNRVVAPVAQRVPLIAGEMGEDDCRHAFIDRLMRWLDEHRAGYLAWTWNDWYGARCTPNLGPGGDISLISDYQGTPFPGMGVGYKAHLAALAKSGAPMTPAARRVESQPARSSPPVRRGGRRVAP
jgi:hypothetical protein